MIANSLTCLFSYCIHQARFLFLLTANIDVMVAIANTKDPKAIISVGSYTISGWGSHVPGKVYTDGCDAKIKFIFNP